MMMIWIPIWPLRAVGSLPPTRGWPDGLDVNLMRTTGPCGPVGEPAVASHVWHFTKDGSRRRSEARPHTDQRSLREGQPVLRAPSEKVGRSATLVV